MAHLPAPPNGLNLQREIGKPDEKAPPHHSTDVLCDAGGTRPDRGKDGAARHEQHERLTSAIFVVFPAPAPATFTIIGIPQRHLLA